MATVDREEPGVWQRLRRRRVTRTAVTYLAVGYAVLEAVWYVVPRLGLVEDVGRIVTGIAVLGFPFAVVLAWTYDLTPEGIVRTPDDPIAEEAITGPILPRYVWVLFWLLAVASASSSGPSGCRFGTVAGVAQLVEQLICNQQVGGSSPFASFAAPPPSRARGARRLLRPVIRPKLREASRRRSRETTGRSERGGVWPLRLSCIPLGGRPTLARRVTVEGAAARSIRRPATDTEEACSF